MVNLNCFSMVNTGHNTSRPVKDSPFNFISNNGKNLVVTVGDSWTYGADMTPNDDNEFRLKNHFGAQVSQALNADWLSLGQGGSGNFWLYEKINEVSRVIPSLDYQHVYVICTLTETGRAINSRTDIDFYRFFVDNHPDNFIEYINDICVNNIVQTLGSFNNVTLKIGINFVDYTGDCANSVLPVNWLRLICDYYKIEYTGNCQIVSPDVINDFKNLTNLVPSSKSNDYMKLLNRLLDNAIQREKLMQLIPANGMRNLHPTALGHRLWADYILENI